MSIALTIRAFPHPMGLAPAVPTVSPRAIRVAVLVVAICILNFIDLAFTLRMFRERGFEELNFIAASMSPTGVFLLKLAAVTVFASICLGLRRQRITELACWGLLAVYLTLNVSWFVFYGAVLVA